jgi:SAM-dependent methyltransferase
MMRTGATHAEIVADLKSSGEYRQRLEQSTAALPDLVSQAPERYMTVRTDDGRAVPAFLADAPEAYDWIEQALADNGFYEKPGVWVLTIDLDKRVMAEIVSRLEPASALEVGCSSGGVLACLDELGIDVCGVDISTFARDRAPDSVRDRIRLGELAGMSFDRTYDVAFGLDIFEHIHPGKLDEFIAALVATIAPGGYLLVNVPAYGEDEVFGEAFPIALSVWREDAARGRRFRHLEVDERGYPVHGHLVFATTKWWVDRFEAAGVHRAFEIERAIHERYDAYFDAHSPARKPLYVFAKDAATEQTQGLARRIRSKASRVLAGPDPNPTV